MDTLWVVVAFLDVLAAWFLVLYGATHLTQATEGVGTIALACFVGIMARMAQASAQHMALTGAIAVAFARRDGRGGPVSGEQVEQVGRVYGTERDAARYAEAPDLPGDIFFRWLSERFQGGPKRPS